MQIKHPYHGISARGAPSYSSFCIVYSRLKNRRSSIIFNPAFSLYSTIFDICSELEPGLGGPLGAACMLRLPQGVCWAAVTGNHPWELVTFVCVCVWGGVPGYLPTRTPIPYTSPSPISHLPALIRCYGAPAEDDTAHIPHTTTACTMHNAQTPPTKTPDHFPDSVPEHYDENQCCDRSSRSLTRVAGGGS
jgi:hypothetical protein